MPTEANEPCPRYTAAPVTSHLPPTVSRAGLCNGQSVDSILCFVSSSKTSNGGTRFWVDSPGKFREERKEMGKEGRNALMAYEADRGGGGRQ